MFRFTCPVCRKKGSGNLSFESIGDTAWCARHGVLVRMTKVEVKPDG